MILSKPTLEWAKEHATQGSDGLYRCNTTKTVLMVQKIWRTIGTAEDFPWNGLEVKQVGHVYCPACMPEPAFPEHGIAIAIGELDGYQF